MRSASAEGMLNLFEEAHIASLDERVGIIVQLKRIQSKLEEDVEKSEVQLEVSRRQQ